MTHQDEGSYGVLIIDLSDAYHYADMYEPERFKLLAKNFGSLEGASALADRLFKALNPKDKTQVQWSEFDGGWDVWVANRSGNCVYKAHTKLPEE